MNASDISSLILSIISMVISITFATLGVILSRKSDQTLSSIQKEVSVQSQQYMHLLEISFEKDSEKWEQARKSDTEKWEQFRDLLKVTLEIQNSPKRKVDPNSPGPTLRQSKTHQINNEEKS